ncbi:lipoprotein [Spiroplasma taiwanense]|nr:lipoprotein [Spiroplasma taiwanense]
MKKLLSLLGMTTIVVSGATTVIACGNEDSSSPASSIKEVIFMIDALTTISSSIINDYKDVVTDFNENHNDLGIEVKIETPSAGQILNSINAGEALPDLYLTYPDNVARYKSIIPDQIVDVKSEGYITDNTIFSEYQSSFLEEGTIGENLYVLPVLKSFNINTVNLRLLNQIQKFLKIQLWNMQQLVYF